MAQTSYSVSIPIAAPPALVWKVMSEVERWSVWTPSIRRIVLLTSGPMAVGSRARVHQPGLPPAVWRVTEWSPGQHFTWISVAPGVRVTARHGVESGPGGCRVTLSLQYEGFLGGLVARLTDRFNRHYLDLEANGLKAHCEVLARGAGPSL